MPAASIGPPVVSVIVPVLDAAGTVVDCLDALARQSGAPAFEVLVVDNGSHDASVALATRHPLHPLVLHERRPGAYAARNAGVRTARGAVLAFTDADCRPAAGWLAAGMAALAAGDADIVGGQIRPVTAQPPTVWARYDAARYLRQDALIFDAGMAATANLFTRASAFAQVGPFDAALRSGGDLEWCRRAQECGLRLRYAPEAVVDHRCRTTLLATWRLHRRLGSGWAALAARGLRPGPAWRDPAIWLPIGAVVDAAAAQGPALRRRHLAGPHLVATLARLTGRLTGC